jgi:hypothetical protein
MSLTMLVSPQKKTLHRKDIERLENTSISVMGLLDSQASVRTLDLLDCDHCDVTVFLCCYADTVCLDPNTGCSETESQCIGLCFKPASGCEDMLGCPQIICGSFETTCIEGDTRCIDQIPPLFAPGTSAELDGGDGTAPDSGAPADAGADPATAE